jgi:hypothetical protein
MATLTLVLALVLTAASVLLTSALASRYGINDESFFLKIDQGVPSGAEGTDRPTHPARDAEAGLNITNDLRGRGSTGSDMQVKCPNAPLKRT